MKVLSIVGATLLATSFHAAAFVSESSVHPVQAVNAGSNPVNGHAIPSEVNYGEVAKIIPVAGCNCAFCSALRDANL